MQKDYRRSKKNPLWLVWRGMHRRCYTPKSSGYAAYGGRGIFVCPRWHVFEHFVDDMADGFAAGLTIEREDNNKPYAPSNCRWATRLEQARNRRNTRNLTNPYTGETKTHWEWARLRGVSYNTINSRLRYGYTEFDDLLAPKLRRWNEKHLVHPATGESRSVSAWAREFHINEYRVFTRLRLGIRDFFELFDRADRRFAKRR